MTGLEGNTRERTVLVVDDEKSILLLLRIALEPGQFRVIVAAGGAEALAAARDVAPELLITDLSMPGLGGCDLARQLRAKFRDMKVLYISGYPVGDDVQSQFVENSAYLQKPFRLDELMSAIHALLGVPRLPASSEIGRPSAAAAAA